MLKKMLISLMATSLPSTTVISAINMNDVQTHYYENLKSDIINNSIKLEDSYYTEYDGQKFYSQDQLDGHIYQQSNIESVVTSSNPSKIVKDYENQVLDGDKVFDTDIETAKKVYRDAFGNVALTHQDALNTYTNPGLVKEKYSYDAQEWFSSAEEAKIYEKNNLDIYKSIFQLWGNNYYNAFNLEDMEKLILNFRNGISVNIKKNLEGGTLKTPYTFVGSESDGFSFIKAKLFNNFVNTYFSQVVKMEHQSMMVVQPTEKHELRIHFSSAPEQDIYYGEKGESFQLVFANKYDSNESMLNDFKNEAWWNKGSEGSYSIGRKYVYRNFKLINPTTGRVEDAVVKTVPNWSYGGGKNKYDFSKYNYSDKTTSVAKLYLDTNKSKYLGSLTNLPKRYSVNDLESGERQRLYDIWFESYFRNVLTKFYYKNSNGSTISNGANVTIKYADVINQKLIANADNSVYKDLYFTMNSGNGKNYSFLQSYFDFYQKN
ncbi:hypothetical protein SCLARK_00666 [Spiroplasma clarkii]|uniref:hypothetical protein n=1 Tax=Spiroplasma clarkii TaxID=2139 RepID=UPI000B585FAB|nr:hypothetical protein [Spiroplasma clarkii]ARU91329.1 hypothetical protein SCLARK_00666 [Spiroplasma clarkii]